MLEIAPAELSSRLEIRLTGQPVDLRVLWAAAMPRVASGTIAGVDEADVPLWARWAEFRSSTSLLTAPTLNLIGHLAT